MTETTLDDVHAEVKKLSRRLDSMEKTLKALMTMILPEEELTQAEWDELREIEAEMKTGECTTLNEISKKYGAA